MILDELLVKLGFDYNPKDIDKFKKDLSGTKDLIQNVATKAIAAATAFNAFIFATTQSSDTQGKLADEIGESVETLNALQYANQRAGNSAEDMSKSLRDLSVRISEASRGAGAGLEAFGELGINVTKSNGSLKTASEVMLEISDRIQEYDKTDQVGLADKLGVKDSLKLLQSGSAGIRQLMEDAKALGVVTAEDAAISAEFQDSLLDFWTIVKEVSRMITRVFVPSMTEANIQFSDWWKANKQIIEQKLPEFIDKITYAVKLMVIGFAAFIGLRLATHLVALINLMKGLTAATIAMNVAAFLIPIAIAALAAAFVALWEDAKVFFEGGDSFIGEMLRKYPQWQTQINTIASIFGAIDATTQTILNGWKEIFDLIGKFNKENASEVLSNLPGFLLDVTKLKTAQGTGLIPSLQNEASGTIKTFVDKIEIMVQGGADSAEKIAQEVFNVFQQTSKDLNTTVDQ